MERTDLDRIAFLNQHLPDGGFLQSEEWKAFQEAMGKKTKVFGEGLSRMNVFEHHIAPVGKYGYIPRGPIMDASTTAIHKTLNDLQKEAKRNHFGWLRIEPAGECDQKQLEDILKDKVICSPHDMQPKELLILSIADDAERLLATMKPKTRYNIRLAEKKGVKVFTTRDPKYVAAFCDLTVMTALRDGIVPHPRSHYETMLRIIPEDMLTLYVAEYQGKVIAANLVMFFGRFATYLHGASSNASREVMAPYALQWQQMQAAKTKGCDRYDLGGVCTDTTDGSWQGITRFKQGFAPYQAVTRCTGSFDIMIHPLQYRVYRILQRVKKWFR